MTEIEALLGIPLVLFGLLLMFTGSIGILRLPDFYCRSHASGKTDTLGIVVLLLGLTVYEGFTLTSAKLVIGIMFISLTNPVVAHAMARAAMRFGLRPWFPPKSAESRETEQR